MMQLMHEIGFGMDVKYGYAEQNILDMIDTGDE
jgi:hypothetical protein